MSVNALVDGLLSYVCLLILLTFHEFAHAWVAWKRGDDTAYQQGRVSLNPIVHMELIGTVVLPLAVVVLAAANSGLANFIIGWGRPVPVNLSNLRRPRFDDTLIALAGPAMNFALAGVVMSVARGFEMAGQQQMMEVALRMAVISLLLCFFNLLPIPPLDGSHVLKNFTRMSFETYYRIAQYGFIIVIVAIQIPLVRGLIHDATYSSLFMFANLVGLGMGR
jgi:Zn-dependent protease